MMVRVQVYAARSSQSHWLRRWQWAGVHLHTPTHIYTSLRPPRWWWPLAPRLLSIRSVKSGFSKRLRLFKKNGTGVWRCGKKFGNGSSETIKANFKRISLGGSGHELDAISTFQLKVITQPGKINHVSSRMRKVIWKTSAMAAICATQNCSAPKWIAIDISFPLLPAFYLCSPSACSHFSVVLFCSCVREKENRSAEKIW